MKEKVKIRNMILTALFAALIYVSVSFLFHIPTGLNNGYIHLGDTFIYLGATLLPFPYGLIAAALGAGLADLLSGAAIWVIPTIIIKPLMAYCFKSNSDKLMNKRNYIAIIVAGIINVVGYYLAEVIFTGSFVAAAVGIVPNILQATGSGVLFLVFAFAFDKINLKNKLLLNK